LNDVTAPQAFPAMTATTTATMTQVPAMTTAITKGSNKLVECFLHPAKTGDINATVIVKVFCFMPKLAQQLQQHKCTKTLAAFHPRQLSNYVGDAHHLLTSVDC
jgi:hypothetical protein